LLHEEVLGEVRKFSHGATESTEVKEKIGCACSPFREKESKKINLFIFLPSFPD
jgi:hypothetical protein